MKKMIVLFLAAVFAACLFPGFPLTARADNDGATADVVPNFDSLNAAPDPFSGGDGLPGSPYIIETPEQLAWLAGAVNMDADDAANGGKYAGKSYRLANDIDLADYGEDWNNGSGWIPIGDTYNQYVFRGSFDGDSHKITGLYINGAKPGPHGLFGMVTGGTVKNLGVAGVNIIGASWVGGVAGYLENGSVANCYATGSISGSARVGGISGYIGNGSRVTNCYAVGVVSSKTYAGGVVGSVSSSSVSNCYAMGAVNGTDHVGGVAGDVYFPVGSVTNCAALNPSVNGASDVGRVAGNKNNSTLSSNIAFSGMTPDGGSAFPTPAGTYNVHNNLNGADISADTILSGGTIGGLFAGALWTTEAGKLPGLFGETVDIPAHILNAVTPKLTLAPDQPMTVKLAVGQQWKIKLDTNLTDLTYSCATTYAIVDSDGVITGLKSGMAVIAVCSPRTGLKVNIVVTVF